MPISKVIRGSSLSNTTRYVLGKEKSALLEGSNVLGKTEREIIGEFELSRRQNQAIEKPCLHLVLSYSKQDEALIDLDQNMLSNLAREHFAGLVVLSKHSEPLSKVGRTSYRKQVEAFMDEGIYQYQFFIALHEDKKHLHTHLVASRIDLAEGKVINSSWDRYKTQFVVRDIEERYGLQINQSSWEKDRAGLSQKQLERWSKFGKTPIKLELQQEINQVLSKSVCLQKFQSELQNLGINSRLYQKESGEVYGISYEKQGVAFRGSQLGKAYSIKGIQAQIGFNETHKQEISYGRAAVAATNRGFGEQDTTTTDQPAEPVYGGTGEAIALGERLRRFEQATERGFEETGQGDRFSAGGRQGIRKFSLNLSRNQWYQLGLERVISQKEGESLRPPVTALEIHGDKIRQSAQQIFKSDWFQRKLNLRHQLKNQVVFQQLGEINPLINAVTEVAVRANKLAQPAATLVSRVRQKQQLRAIENLTKQVIATRQKRDIQQNIPVLTEIVGKLEQAAQTATLINEQINQSKNEFLKKAYLTLQDIWQANKVNHPRLEAVNFGDYTVRPDQAGNLELLKQGEVLLRLENNKYQDYGVKLTDMAALKRYHKAAQQKLTKWELAKRLQDEAIAKKMVKFLHSNGGVEFQGASKTLKIDIETKILTFTPNGGGDPQFRATWTGSSWKVDVNQLNQEEKDRWLQWDAQTEKQKQDQKQQK